MINKIKDFIKKEQLFNKGNKIIVAVSGGKDSVALTHILHQLNYKIIVAHCNFQLRDSESDEDEIFVHNLCKDLNIEFECIKFDTKTYSKKHKISTQEAARTLRYNWFEELRLKHKASCIATAHHLNDNIETFIFKATKGTGVKGIRGILPKNKHIVRPLLNTSLAEIENYIKENKITYREDSSNASLKYDRNKIRQEIIPNLKSINESLEESFINHFERWRNIELFYKQSIENWKKKNLKQKNKDIFIAIAAIKNVDFAPTILFEVFQEYGFKQSDINDLLNSLDSTEVKYFYTNEYRIIKDKKFIVLTNKNEEKESSIQLINLKNKKVELSNNQFVRVSVKPVSKLSKLNKKEKYSYLDVDKLKFPLVLRHKKDGDYFYPFGLTKKSGKASKKKLSKFFKDEKITAYDKENCWILCSNEKIACVLNHRIDDRFKITDKTKNVLILQYEESKN